MADLVTNVFVDGTWFGPSYPANGKPPAGAVENKDAFEESEAEAPAPRKASAKKGD
jgi:hypothetical protein